jgi:twitching motility two-component system response regulator PilG
MTAMRLLVIDDSQTIRKLVEIAFRGSGFVLDFAATGAEGVSKAEHHPPSAILLDYILPDMRATEVCRRLTALERCAQLPVVLMSAKTELVKEDFRSVGRVVGFLGKPFTAEEVVARINAAVQLPAAPPSVAAQAPARPARSERFTFKQKEAAARVLYHNLRRHLEALPGWAQERGEAAAAPFFARKLFTGEVVEGLLEELLPLLTELAAPEPPRPAPDPSALQHDLEKLRRPSVWGAADARLGDGEQIFERAAAFSAKLRQVQLGANEQRVLTVVDGRASLRAIAERTGLELREVGRILFRLGEIDLVQPRHTLHPSSVVTSRTLAILDRDREGVQHPLQALLRRRPEPIEVRDLGSEADPVAMIKRERPCLVILNQEGATLDIAEIAREIRHSEPLANISLAAVLERRSAARIDQLAAAGFDAVWVKPLHFREVNQLIASAFLAADLVRDERREHHGNNSHH